MNEKVTENPRVVASPWGPVQSQRPVGPGLTFVNTASHGGLYLSIGRVEELRHAIPGFKPWAGWPWLEEDCDAAVAPIVWPEFYSAEARRSAVKMYLRSRTMTNGQVVQDYLIVTPQGQALCVEASKWEIEHAQEWETGGGSTQYGGWVHWFYRVGDKAQISRWFKSYPAKSLYTDSELQSESLPVGQAAQIWTEANRPKARPLVTVTRSGWERIDSGLEVDAAGQCYSDADPGL